MRTNLFAKISFDTAESESCKVCPLSVYVIIRDPPGTVHISSMQRNLNSSFCVLGGAVAHIDEVFVDQAVREKFNL